MKNGLIVFILGDLPDAQRLISISITNTWPMISIGPRSALLGDSGILREIEAFDHLSIPPDLNIHITRNKKIEPKEKNYIFFDLAELREKVNSDSLVSPSLLCAVAGPNLSNLPPLVDPGARKKWEQFALVAPFLDELCGSSTRFVVEIYIHSTLHDGRVIEFFPPAIRGTRQASTRGGSLWGPFSLTGMFRRGRPARHDLALSFKMGFIEHKSAHSSLVFVPYSPKLAAKA